MINEPRDMTAMEELQVFTLAHFYLNSETESDGISGVQKMMLMEKYGFISAMCLGATAGYCNISETGFDFIDEAYEAVIKIGYPAKDRDSFLDDL